MNNGTLELARIFREQFDAGEQLTFTEDDGTTEELTVLEALFQIYIDTTERALFQIRPHFQKQLEKEFGMREKDSYDYTDEVMSLTQPLLDALNPKDRMVFNDHLDAWRDIIDKAIRRQRMN